MLAKLCETPEIWDEIIEKVEFAINNTICRSTGHSPSKLLLGIDQLGKTSDSIRILLESNVENDRDLNSMRKKALDKIIHCQKENELAYNKRHKIPISYQVDDYVMIQNVDTTPGINKKLIPKFKGLRKFWTMIVI